jgi:hypothetical protein
MCSRSEKGSPGKKKSLLTATFSDEFADKLKQMFAENMYY